LNKPLNNNGILEGLRKMGYPKKSMCGHGFRAMARTLLAEVGVLSDYIEPQLAHTVPDANKTSYNRTKFLLARRNMMQIWSDYLDHLRIGREPGAFRVRVVEQEPEFLVAA
jgi:integrase